MVKTGYFILVSGLFTACSSERISSSPASPREPEVRRWRAPDPGTAPVLFGQVDVVDPTGHFPVSKAQVSLDGQASYTDENGAYRLRVAPGTHQVLVSQTGMRPDRVAVKVARGDSVRVDFYLRPVQ